MGGCRVRKAENRQQRPATGDQAHHRRRLGFRYQFDTGAGRLALSSVHMHAVMAMGSMALLGIIDPAADALLTFLHDRENTRWYSASRAVKNVLMTNSS